jgi:two-component system, NtrC family, response regulator GlrR
VRRESGSGSPAKRRSCAVSERAFPHAYDLVLRHALDIDESGDSLAFGSTTGSLWITGDQGDSWKAISSHLPPSYCTIGSAPGCDLVIAAPTVSRTHVELGLVPEGVLVRDLGSRNGTYFSGQRVEKRVLSFGGRIRVGSATVAVEADAESLDAAPAYAGTFYRGIVGASPALRRLFAVLQRLEGSLATVLIDGESGVGKERFASALHEGSSVAGGPLVIVNCGALPRELVASELFGHRRGAFSGALESRRGAFEAANGGTLFLGAAPWCPAADT